MKTACERAKANKVHDAKYSCDSTGWQLSNCKPNDWKNCKIAGNNFYKILLQRHFYQNALK